MKHIFYCNPVFKLLLLISFFGSSAVHAEVDEQRNKSLEDRLHKIYESSYSRPVADSEWFKMMEGVEQQTHIVKPKDTLWSISKIYFGDGFFWSKLWSVNSRITNPHLIFVGDQIHFTVGGPSRPPTINIKKGEGLTSVEEDDGEGEDEGGLEEVADEGSIEVTPAQRKSQPIPPIFANSVDLREVKPPKREVTVVPRPVREINTVITLTSDILSEPPKVFGTIVSVGVARKISGQYGKVIIKATDSMSVGDSFSIIAHQDSRVDHGYEVKLLGTARITGQTEDGKYYEALVTSQFGEIQKASLISGYQVQTVKIDGGGSVGNTAFTVLSANERILWAREDIVLLKATNGSFNVGELLRVKNYLDPDFKAFQSSGLLKVATVSGSYAAAVVVYASAEITSEDTISGM